MEIYRSRRRRRLTLQFGRTNNNNNNQEDEDNVKEEETTGEEETRDWSSLTEPLLLSILQLLTTLEDFFAFHGVCQNWRSLSFPTPHSTSSQSPLILLTRFPSYTKAFFDITQKRIYKTFLPWNGDTRYTLGYSHGHLITATRGPNQKILLWNLFTEDRTRFPKAPIQFERVILSSSPSSPDCLVLLLEFSGSVLQYCRPGDRRWSLHYWSPLQIKDMIFFQGRLYVLTRTGQLGIVNLFPHPEFLLLEDEAKAGIDMKTPNCHGFLAESGGELLLVCISFGVDWFIRFEICRWDFQRGGWVKVSNLGQRALFIGYRGFAASLASSGSGVRENCIYYTSCRMNEWIVYSLEDRTTMVVDTYASPGLVRGWIDEPPVWVFPNLC